MSDTTPPPNPLSSTPPPLSTANPPPAEGAMAGGLSAGGFAAAATPAHLSQPAVLSSNLVLGIVGGAIAAVVGAVIWAAITVTTNLEIGYAAVGLAFLVGVAVRNLGRGYTQVYGVVGAVCSLLGIVLGKVFTVIWIVADKDQVSVFSLLGQIDWSKLFGVIGDTLGPIDFVFGVIALMLGFKYSIRKH